MLTILLLCSTVSALTGVRMIWSALFGARRAAPVPGARLVRDANGDVAAPREIPVILRVAAGLSLIALGFAVLYFVERMPR